MITIKKKKKKNAVYGFSSNALFHSRRVPGKNLLALRIPHVPVAVLKNNRYTSQQITEKRRAELPS